MMVLILILHHGILRDQILLNNPQYEVFKEKILLIEKSIESYLEELKKARFESLDVELRTHLNNLIKQALSMLIDQIELLDRKLPSPEKYKNPILNMPEAKEVGFPINGEGLIKFIGQGEVNKNETEPVHDELTKPPKKEISAETTLEDFDVSNIESPPQVYKPKIKPGFNWDFDSERFQDEPWKMSKYDVILNTIIINDNHPFWHNIRNLSDETLKFRLKWDYIVALTLKEIILFNLQRESNPFAAQFDNNMESYIRFLVKMRELQGRYSKTKLFSNFQDIIVFVFLSFSYDLKPKRKVMQWSQSNAEKNAMLPTSLIREPICENVICKPNTQEDK